jgi:hypothetical protein
LLYSSRSNPDETRALRSFAAAMVAGGGDAATQDAGCRELLAFADRKLSVVAGSLQFVGCNPSQEFARVSVALVSHGTTSPPSSFRACVWMQRVLIALREFVTSSDSDRGARGDALAHTIVTAADLCGGLEAVWHGTPGTVSRH